MTALVLYSLLSASMFYLGSRAIITQPIWSRYPLKLALLMDCPACTGFWWGTIWALVIGRTFNLPFFELHAFHPATPAIVGLTTIVTTPLVVGAMTWGLMQTGQAILPSMADAAGEDPGTSSL